jgi:hypothetical protein
MSTPRPKGSGASATLRPPSFIGKAYGLVSDPATDHLVCWDHDGETFTVRNAERLAADVFPAVFAHGSYPSFTRALNAYGFRQVSRNKWRHPDFQRGALAALDSIQRRRPPGKRPAGGHGGGAGADGGGEGEGAGAGAAARIQVELLGFNAVGCMQLIDSQRRSLSELQADIAELKSELRSARSEEVQLQSTVTGAPPARGGGASSRAGGWAGGAGTPARHRGGTVGGRAGAEARARALGARPPRAAVQLIAPVRPSVCPPTCPPDRLIVGACARATGVLSVLVNEYGRTAIESALGYARRR